MCTHLLRYSTRLSYMLNIATQSVRGPVPLCCAHIHSNHPSSVRRRLRAERYPAGCQLDHHRCSHGDRDIVEPLPPVGQVCCDDFRKWTLKLLTYRLTNEAETKSELRNGELTIPRLHVHVEAAGGAQAAMALPALRNKEVWNLVAVYLCAMIIFVSWRTALPSFETDGERCWHHKKLAELYSHYARASLTQYSPLSSLSNPLSPTKASRCPLTSLSAFVLPRVQYVSKTNADHSQHI